MEGTFLNDISLLENIIDGNSKPQPLNLSFLKHITDNFSDNRLAGSGGFGDVFRGKFKDVNIAVKRLKSSNKAEKEFEREIRSLVRVEHKNIVRFLGYCNSSESTYMNVAQRGEPERRKFVQKQERILCFEYISNGDLRAHIHDELRGLEWDTRYKILKDICQGVQYLHNTKMVHRDLKPENILLDNLMVPKIADLGICKLLDGGASQSMTTSASSTFGYAGPELIDGNVSYEYDIFSLGVIITELVTGFSRTPDVKNVLTRWRHRWNKSNETLKYRQVAKCILIGKSCRSKTPMKRPSISKIIKELEDMDGGNVKAGQVIPCWNELLWVEPPELFFPFELHNEISCSLELYNEADANIAFFIETDSQLQYSVKPEKGVVSPCSHFTVNITLLAQEEAPEKMWNDKEFTVKSTRVNEGLKDEDITEAIFSENSSNIVDKTMLRVIFDAQIRAPYPLKVKKETQSAPPALKDYVNGDPKLRKSYADVPVENIYALIDCLGNNLGYSNGKPVAAFTIYRCFIHWKSFEAENTSVFDSLLQLIGSALKNGEDDNDNLAYWLSNTSTLFFLLQRSLGAAGTPGSVTRRKPPQPTSLIGRMAQGILSASFANMDVEATDVVPQIKAKYPALVFKLQLTAYVEKIYGVIRDNTKKELSHLLSLCIQAPRTMKASMLRIHRRSPGQPQSNHWLKIIEKLDVLLKVLQYNNVPPVLAQKIFTQIFSYINVELFNSLLLRRECCSFGNGEYVKAGLAELELWCAKATYEYAASSWDEIRHIRQAVGFLVIFQKFRISYDEIANDLCPILSVQQLYRICTQYWDDKYNTQSVSSDVISNMRVVMTEDSNNAESSSFLLEDNSSIPFSVEDITNTIQENDFSDVKPAGALLENHAFQFLQDC